MTIIKHGARYAIVDDETGDVIKHGFETRQDAYEAMWDRVSENIHGEMNFRVA